VTKVLLNFGADPNDNETPYHAPETGDNRAVQALLDSGKLSAKSLSMMLIRKADWHDFDGVTMLLEHGADPNLMTQWGVTALHQAIKRDNQLATIELMLDHGADPYLPNNSDKRTAITMAARRGRGDVLNAIKDRGFDITAVDELERLIQACALDDREAIANASLEAIRMLKSQPSLLAEFAGTGNTVGVLNLLDLGIACDTRYGRTALGLAVRACVNSYWMSRRKPDSVRYLLEAGAKPIGIPLPCGYGEIDAMLTQSD
jgi:ankyrin repeat protein